ncbi:MAG: hypothetical protein AVDCRST_MAG85-358 [uncultured Solirubrobacteraceae bacterium]|uniref:Uncharacterized protein n=1 Tax=uncultured Solirubrobacteraceae bacterium TaxID=1162706 RepID=A0A6J4RVR1_9ACTN|nr:MAG: hypothetical protein AVDCRST_MAG85-358 [uncultured Solirubrobacteraceae bacterium]
MSPAIAPFVSAISVMLGAYGFFFNAYKSRIDDGLEASTSAANKADRDAAKRRVTSARNAATLLALVPLAVFALLLPQVEDQLVDGTWDLARYSTLDVLFVVLSFAWLGIFLVVAAQWRKLQAKLKSFPA